MSKNIKPTGQKEQAVKVGFYDDSLKSTQAVPCGGLHSWLKKDLCLEMARRDMYSWPEPKTAEQQKYQGGYTFKNGRGKE